MAISIGVYPFRDFLCAGGETRMQNFVIYIHGKGGSADEAEHYKPLFPTCDVIGFDYHAGTPWDAKAEFTAYFAALQVQPQSVILIANSIGAFLSMHAGIDRWVEKAFFISPVVDMEALIGDMMRRANVTEDVLREQGVVRTGFGEDLSWAYLSFVRSHPIRWNVPTDILYGSADSLVTRETVDRFAEMHHASLTVMDGGEHWFHTPEQMRFLDAWITRKS